MALCSRQEKCRFEISQKLKDWGLPETLIEKIILQLVKEGFINEERYAKAFVNDKFKINKWGKQKIRFALMQKSIGKDIIVLALDTIAEKEYNNMLKNEMEKKFKSIKTLEKSKILEKLIRFGLSKGFSNEEIYPVVNSLLQQ